MTLLGGMPKSSDWAIPQAFAPPAAHPRSTCCPFESAASHVASVRENRYDARSPTTAAPGGAVKIICARTPWEVPAACAGIVLRATIPAFWSPPVGHCVYAVIHGAFVCATQ